MSYEVVARRWRPSTFASVVGQRHVTATLVSALERERVAHAFLFTGVRGVGKTTVARLLARALNCQARKDGEPCNECSSCTQILENRSVDVLEIDGASNRGIDEMRTIIEAVAYRPAVGPYRIYIIDEVHQLSKDAFNALLKTLEEPPSHVKFIMATTEVHKLPATVLSRCQRYDFRRLGIDEIAKQLTHIVKTDKLEITPDAITLVAREADGSMRDAQSLLEQVVAAMGGKVGAAEAAELLGVAGVGMVARTVEAILGSDAKAVVEISREIRAGGYDPEKFLVEVLDALRHVTVAQAAGVDAIGEEHGEAARTLAAKLVKARSPLDLHRIFQSLMQTAVSLRRGSLPDLVLEMGLLKASALESVESAAEVLAELRRAPGATSGGGSNVAAPARGATPARGGPPPRGNAETRPGSTSSPAPEKPMRTESAPRPRDVAVSPAEEEGAPWEEFLADVRKALGVELYTALSNCEVTVLTDRCLEIRPQKEMFRRTLEGPAMLDRVREVAVARFGAGFEVRMTRTADAAAAQGQPGQGSSQGISVARIETERQKRIEREALEDPAVKAAMEILGGKVDKIQRLDE